MSISASDITRSEELFARVSTGIELCYQTYGEASAEPLVLVMGLSAQMTWWPDAMCRQLADAGFYVIRLDNRDAGRSESFPGGTGRPNRRIGRGDLVRAALGLPGAPPYTLSDMGADVFGLLDHLGIDNAHIVGASMGGMIIQTMAIEHPERVRSAVSIMSTTGRRVVGWQNPLLLPRLLQAGARTRDEYVERTLQTAALIGSPAYPDTREALVSRAEETWDRGMSSVGVLRQMLAILRQPDRTAALRSLRVPFGVIHGTADRMVHASGGRATAAAVRGAELDLIEGMGHDLPKELHPRFVALIRRVADRAA
ncbi:MAG: alpha/beta fold hydrolase [Marmoricola sp.]